jgi:hypothetical protein
VSSVALTPLEQLAMSVFEDDLSLGIEECAERLRTLLRRMIGQKLRAEAERESERVEHACSSCGLPFSLTKRREWQRVVDKREPLCGRCRRGARAPEAGERKRAWVANLDDEARERALAALASLLN